MRDELLNEIFRIIDKSLCPQIGIPLVDGRVELVLKPQSLQVLNRFQSEEKNDGDTHDPFGGRYDDVILTETERLKLSQFFRTLAKLPTLCVRQRSVHSSDNFIDLRSFKKLTSLKLTRVNLKNLKWVSNLKSQLSTLKCSHSVETISIFCDTLAWAELVTLSVNFCDVNPTDNSHYFKNSPWIRKLDLSHCKLRKCDFVVHLEHLEYLNLSYNCISQIPQVGRRCKIRTLIMSFNNVFDLSGLEGTPTLTALDLSDNWIPDKYSLGPLKHLRHLQSVKLRGSPVSMIKFYRIYVASCLCLDADKSQVSIDGVLLTKIEQTVVGLKLFDSKGISGRREPTANVDVNEPSTSRGLVEASPSLSVITGIEYRGKVYSVSGFGRKTVRVPIIWDESKHDPNQSPSSSLEEASGGPKGSTVFPSKPLPTVEQNLNEELTALREALIRTQPVAGSVNSTEESQMISTILSPDSFNLQPSPQPHVGNPGSDILPATVEVQVHATESDLQADANENHEFDRKALEQSEEGPNDHNVLQNALDVEKPEFDHKVKLRSVEDYGSDSGVCSDHHELVSSTECESTAEPAVHPDNDKTESPSNSVQGEEDVNVSEEKTSVEEEQIIPESTTTELLPSNDVRSLSNSVQSLDENNPETDQETTKVDVLPSDNGSVLSTDNNLIAEESETGTDNKLFVVGEAKSSTNSVQIMEESDPVTDQETTMMDVLPSDTSSVLPTDNNLMAEELETGTVRSNELFVVSEESSKESDEESCYESDADADELLWQVVRTNLSDDRCEAVFLALLETELKERSPKSGETLTKWPLNSVLSCVKTKNDPITIEMEFDTKKKDSQHRVYIMEYADAKTLTKKIYSILESRPLSAMNQVSLKCLTCASMFVHMKPPNNKNKEGPIQCPICRSSTVAEAEEPKLPDNVPAPKPLSHAASHSSIGSAASIEQSHKSGGHLNRKYESDIEVISNPSQSSIEVIDESSRSQSVTPRRKMSEEHQPLVRSESSNREAAPLSVLTESSSSGSLTESVITAYESLSVTNKKSVSAVSLLREVGGNPTDNSVFSSFQGTLEEENGNIAVPKSTQDVYSFTDFLDVDLRVKTFIYHSIFKNENEELRALVRCHIWKTGGTDYDGCFVLSSLAAYFLFHERTNFSQQICDWLSLNESFPLSDIKRVQSIVWDQGIEVQVKNFSFLLLLMDQERTKNVVEHFAGLSLKGVKVISKPNTKIELSLQQAVLTCELINTHDDPTVTLMLICRSVEISKGDGSEEILRLPGLIITAGLFLLVPGDLSWLCSAIQPSIVSSQDLPSLIEVAEKGTDVVLRFFNESEATEEKWIVKLYAAGQLSPLLDAIRKPWESKFSVPLEVISL